MFLGGNSCSFMYYYFLYLCIWGFCFSFLILTESHVFCCQYCLFLSMLNCFWCTASILIFADTLSTHRHACGAATWRTLYILIKAICFADWGPNIDVVGFCFLDLASNYQPPDSLVKWLEAGKGPIYVGFGSLVSFFALNFYFYFYFCLWILYFDET